MSVRLKNRKKESHQNMHVNMLTDYKAEINNMNTQKHHLINIFFSYF